MYIVWCILCHVFLPELAVSVELQLLADFGSQWEHSTVLSTVKQVPIYH